MSSSHSTAVQDGTAAGGSCRKCGEAKGGFSFIPLRLQNPALAELLSLGEEKGKSNMKDLATLLKAQPCP